MSLRDTLLQSLETLPGSRTFRLHVLVTSPRKHTGLFPYARPRPRVNLQDVLILLSEQPPNAGAPAVFVSAIEAAAYTVPASDAALLYVAKVDSTGQGAAPAPTGALVRALLAFYADPRTRPLPARHLWIHVFARAQSQYLFPNSADFEGKRMLSDIRLCAWWKRILEETVAALRKSPEDAATSHTAHMSYLLPGMNEVEAARALQLAAQSTIAPPVLPSASQPPIWEYGHPFASSSGIPLPCPPPPDGQVNLGHYIPYFEDDPKSRFLDEIACTSDAPGVRSPPPKRRKVAKDDATDAPDESASGTAAPTRPHGDLGRVVPAEFWERISFRQECVAGAVTGFFALAVSAPPARAAEAAGPAAPARRPGEVSVHVYRRVHSALTTANEFSTTARAVRATATIEGAIRDLCEDGVLEQEPVAPAAPSSSAQASSADAPRATTPEPTTSHALPAPPRTPPRKPPAHVLASADEASPSPFPEPAPTREAYSAHIYGSVRVANASPVPRAAAGSAAGAPATVNMLTARKKQKRVGA
jgi:regulator of Ty1 transposition protein 109